MYDYEQALEDARFFEKNVNTCLEYEDAWVFRNSRKKPGAYNPVVIMKADGDAVPYGIYRKTKLLGTHEIKKK